MRVDAPVAGRIVRVLEDVLGPDVSDTEADTGDEVSKLNLNCEDRDGVEGTVTKALAPMGLHKRI